MPNLKNQNKKIKKSYFYIAGVLLLVLLAISLLCFNDNSTSMQSASVIVGQVYFEGEYRIADGDWKPIVEGEHIPATKGDVTLRGNFHELDPDGNYVGVFREEIPIAFHTNHINLTIIEKVNEFLPDEESGLVAEEANEAMAEEQISTFVTESEDPLYRTAACADTWTAYTLVSGPEDLVEIVIHNPHEFGNDNAIDEMLSGLTLWWGIDFEKGVLSSGETERNIGLFLFMVSIMLLGIALFSSLIHIKNSKIIWVLGSLVLFAGLYFTYNADGVSFWSESVVLNTKMLGASMMFYMFFFAMLVVCILTTTRKIGKLAIIFLGVANAVCFVLPIISKVLFYDTWLWWVIAQLVINLVLAICLVREIFDPRTKFKWLYIGAFLPLIAFAVDVVGVWFSIWDGGLISQCVFAALFFVAIIMVLKLIPSNINAATKAKELEMEKIVLNAELTESRMSTMMSQIRPHFIYNTLGSIEQLCEIEPKKAGELVHDFAKYLRGNFGELDNPKPILMSQEMDHVHHYVSIENVRFPDMSFSFEMNSDDFHIPALTVQPIVENAIKHGLMKLPKGGTIKVVSYETETDYCVSVVDDGIGFDTDALIDERKHVGLRNIRERLKVMVNGKLEIESTIGVGTKVLVTIPKEDRK